MLKCILRGSVNLTVPLLYLIFHLIAQHIFRAAPAGLSADPLSGRV